MSKVSSGCYRSHYYYHYHKNVQYTCWFCSSVSSSNPIRPIL